MIDDIPGLQWRALLNSNAPLNVCRADGNPTSTALGRRPCGYDVAHIRIYY